MVADIFALHGRDSRAHARAHALLPVPAHGEPGRCATSSCAPGSARSCSSCRPAPSARLLQARRHGVTQRVAGTAAAAGFRLPAPRPSAPTPTGTRCRSRNRRTACSMRRPHAHAAQPRRRSRSEPDDVRPLRAAQPSGRDRAGVRPRAAARRAPALQHRADDRCPDRARQRRGRARIRPRALGPRAAWAKDPVDRQQDDQCARRDDRRQAVVPDGLPAASLPAARRRLLRMGGRAPAEATAQAAAAHRDEGRLAVRLGGLYERWLSPEGEVLDTCTIVTTAANELLAAGPRPDADDRRARATTRAGSTPRTPRSPT